MKKGFQLKNLVFNFLRGMVKTKSDKLKILFFIDSLRAGGKERRFTELLKVLKFSSDIEFEIVIMNEEVHYEEIFNLNSKIHYLIRKRKKDLSVFRKFYRICNNYEADIVHCWDSMTAVIAVPACKLLNIRLINGMVIDAPVKTNIFNKHWLRAKLSFPFSNIIIGNSSAGLLAYQTPLNKSFVVHNGYNFKRNERLIDKEILRIQLNISTKYIIGMVAAFSEFKDYKTYYSAACIVLTKRHDVTFLAIGNNTDSIDSQKLVDKQFRDDYFRFLGKKSDIESYINMIDVGVLSDP